MAHVPDPTYATRPRAGRRRRRFVAFFVIAVVFLAGLYTAAAAFAPLPSAANAAGRASTIVQPAVQPDWPSWGSAAVGAVGYDGVLIKKGSDASVPIASMTKTITALVILDKKPITTGDGPTITFTADDVAIFDRVIAEGGSWAPVVAGEQLTERQALEAMMLPSANNYAISLAIWAYGSVDAFLSAGNAWLAHHGFTGTHLTDPAGLDPGSVSTPTDLVGIGKLVLADPVLSTVVSTKTVTLPGAGTQDNGNKLLGTDGIDGVKTGFTDEAGHCLMFSADVRVGGKKIEVIGVVLGAASYGDLWTSVPPLLTSVKDGFHAVDLTSSTTFGDYTTAWGEKTSLTAAKDATMVVWSDTPVNVTVRSTPVGVASPGDDVGTVTFTEGTTTVKRELTVTRPITDPGLLWRLAHPIDLFL
jgi:D-alanyl-D-alanine carboxypeptidase (penicillin-binding protein 5/6)